MWTPKIKIFDGTFHFPCACETKIDGEFIFWDGSKLINKHGYEKQSITKLPPIPLYGELYYGEGKEYYSEIHSHAGINNKVILYDTNQYGNAPYIQRRTALELLAKKGFPIVPMTTCYTENDVLDVFKKTTNAGFEGIVCKPLVSFDDSSWFKMKREYTATLMVRGLKKEKECLTAVMGTADHIYCSVSLRGWQPVAGLLRDEKAKTGKNWIVGEDKEAIFINSNIKLQLIHNGVILPNEKLRNPRVKRICSPDAELNVQKQGGLQ